MAALRWDRSPATGGPSHPCWTPPPQHDTLVPTEQVGHPPQRDEVLPREQPGIFPSPGMEGFIPRGVWAHLASRSKWARFHQVGATTPPERWAAPQTAWGSLPPQVGHPHRADGSVPSAQRNAPHREGSTLTEEIGAPLQTREAHQEQKAEKRQREVKVPAAEKAGGSQVTRWECPKA